METILTLLKVLESALSIWNDSQKNKYMEEILDLKRSLEEELDKPTYSEERDEEGIDMRSDDRVNDILRDIRILGEAFSDSVRKS